MDLLTNDNQGLVILLIFFATMFLIFVIVVVAFFVKLWNMTDDISKIRDMMAESLDNRRSNAQFSTGYNQKQSINDSNDQR